MKIILNPLLFAAFACLCNSTYAQWNKKYEANFVSPDFYVTGKIIAPDSLNMRAIGWKRDNSGTSGQGGPVLTNLSIQYSNNGGNTIKFSNPVINVQGRFLSDIYALNKDTTFVIATKTYDAFALGYPNSFIYKSVKGVDSFTKVSSNNMFLDSAWGDFICFFDNKNGLVVGDPTYDTAAKAIGKFFEIYTTTDCGVSWSRVPSAHIPKPLSGEFPFAGVASNAYAIKGDCIWFVTNTSRVFKSIDKGYTWTVKTLTVAPNRSSITNSGSIAFKDANNGLIGTNGCVYKTQDAGDTWDLVYDCMVAPAIPYPRFFANNIVHAKGTDGLFLGTNEKFEYVLSTSLQGQGKTWYSYDGIEWKLFGTTLTGNNYDKLSLSALCFESPNNAWIGGLDATVYKWGSKKLPPNFQLTSPATGQKLLCGKTYPLQFTSSNVDSIEIDITSNGGTTWAPLIKYAWGSKMMTWKTSSTPIECKLKMIAFYDTAYNKISAPITIEMPKMGTTFPKGGEVLNQNTEYTISWNSPNVDSVNIYYTTDSGTTWIPLVNNTGANATIKWTTPLATSLRCAIRVAALYDTSYYYQTPYFSIKNTTGIDEIENNKLRIYPNPVHDLLYVNTNLDIENISVFNMLGEEVLKTTDLSIDCSKLNNGVYTLQLNTYKTVITQRVIKF